MTVHLLAGWSEQDKGAGTVGSYAPYLREAGFDYAYFGQDWSRLRSWALIQQRRRTEEAAEILARRLRPGDHIVAFSNGNVVARKALLRCKRPIGAWVAIGPAMPKRQGWPENVLQVAVMHSRGDWAVVGGTVWMAANPFQWLDRDWGMKGRCGDRSGDDRVQNWQGRRGRRHLGWFDDEPVEHWAPQIVEFIQEAQAEQMRTPA